MLLIGSTILAILLVGIFVITLEVAAILLRRIISTLRVIIIPHVVVFHKPKFDLGINTFYFVRDTREALH